MLTVHHLAHSRSQRVLWLLEELGVPYEVKRYERVSPSRPIAPPELKAIHPLGKSPVIVDGTRTIAETGAIFEYLLEFYGPGALVPTDPEARLQYRYWLHFAEGSAMPWLVMRRVMQAIGDNAPRLLRPLLKAVLAKADEAAIGKQINANLAYCNDALAATGWFAGDRFSAADVMMSLPLEVARSRADITPYPHIVAFLDRIQARETYRKALVRGGEYLYAT